MKKQLLDAPDKILKDVSPGDVNQIQIAIKSINNRVMDKAEANQEKESLQLEICKKCLASEKLERRILGIKELNAIVKSVQFTTGTF